MRVRACVHACVCVCVGGGGGVCFFVCERVHHARGACLGVNLHMCVTRDHLRRDGDALNNLDALRPRGKHTITHARTTLCHTI
jgi:hypothetical protein